MPMGGDIQDWFKSLPLFTRYWFGGTILFTLLGRFGLLQPAWLVLYLEPLIHRFQIWRPITALFYYPLSPQTGFHFLINLYFLYNYSLRLETGIFDGRPADYFFMLVFAWICSVVVALGMEIYYFMDIMVMSILYIWCQLNKDVQVSFWFGTKFKAVALPWVLFAFNFIINRRGFDELMGILIGHLYYFLEFRYSQDFGGPRLLSTPRIFHRWFPNSSGNLHGYGQTSAFGNTNNNRRESSIKGGFRAFGGAGNRLGS